MSLLKIESKWFLPREDRFWNISKLDLHEEGSISTRSSTVTVSFQTRSSRIGKKHKKHKNICFCRFAMKPSSANWAQNNNLMKTNPPYWHNIYTWILEGGSTVRSDQPADRLGFGVGFFRSVILHLTICCCKRQMLHNMRKPVFRRNF